MSTLVDDAVAKWLVGDRLASVLVLDDTPLAAQLADQGHEVVVATQRDPRFRHDEIGYVAAAADRFPFVDASFSAVLTARMPSPTELGGIARVLSPGGWFATWAEGFDETLPWLRKLRDLVGGEPTDEPDPRTLDATGLFDAPQTEHFASWEQLDLEGLRHLAGHRMGATPDDATLDEARALFTQYGADHQPLRLRRTVLGVRARILKEHRPDRTAPDEAVLFEFH